MSLCLGLEAAGSSVVFLPVGIVHRVDADRFAGAGCMDKAVIADVQANVIAACAALSAEKYRIPRFQIMPVDFLQFRAEHGCGGSWYMDIGFVLEQIHQHAAAIEALFQ